MHMPIIYSIRYYASYVRSYLHNSKTALTMECMASLKHTYKNNLEIVAVSVLVVLTANPMLKYHTHIMVFLKHAWEYHMHPITSTLKRSQFERTKKPCFIQTLRVIQFNSIKILNFTIFLMQR